MLLVCLPSPDALQACVDGILAEQRPAAPRVTPATPVTPARALVTILPLKVKVTQQLLLHVQARLQTAIQNQINSIQNQVNL